MFIKNYLLKLILILSIFINITNSAISSSKPQQSRDLNKFPLAAIYYHDINIRSEKTLKKLTKISKEIANKYQGGQVIIPPLKSLERAREKVDTDYKGNWKALTDLVRGSMSVANLKDIYNAIEEFDKSELKIIYIKDRFKNPSPSGYRDINTLFYDNENQIIGEMQFHLYYILEAKEKEYKFYKIIRSLEANAMNENRELTKVEKDRISKLRAESKKLFDKAFYKSMQGKVY